jgi:hypothetical protein
MIEKEMITIDKEETIIEKMSTTIDKEEIKISYRRIEEEIQTMISTERTIEEEMRDKIANITTEIEITGIGIKSLEGKETTERKGLMKEWIIEKMIG